VVYGGVAFSPCLTLPGFSVLRAREERDFQESFSTVTTKMVKDQYVLAEQGMSLRELTISKEHEQSGLPSLRRVLQSAPSLVAGNPALGPRYGSVERLPPWLSRQEELSSDAPVFVRHIGSEGFFEIVDSGQSGSAPTANAPAGSVWHVQMSG